MFNDQNNSQGHFNGSWNPDAKNVNSSNQQVPEYGNRPGQTPQEPQRHGPGKGPMPMPTSIDSEWSTYIISGLVAYSIYKKYFSKEDYDGDGKKEGCPVNDEPLNFVK